MNASLKELTAEDYSYRLPDHWSLDDQNPSGYFEIVNRAYTIESSNWSKRAAPTPSSRWDAATAGIPPGSSKQAWMWSASTGAKTERTTPPALTPKAQIYCGDVRDADFSARFPQPFDAVVFVEVIEHIAPNVCVRAIRNIAATIMHTVARCIGSFDGSTTGTT